MARVPSSTFLREVSTVVGLYSPSAQRSCLHTKGLRAAASSVKFSASSPLRLYTTGTAHTTTQTPFPEPHSRFRRFVGFTSIAVVAFTAGLLYQAQQSLGRAMAAPMPTDEESLSAFVAPDDLSREIDDFIRSHPISLALRENSAFTEARPHLKIPENLRARNLTAGTLAGPDRIVVPPYVFTEEGGKSLVSISYLGSDVSGHPGIVHGGLLATLLDEGLARCCFPALPNGVGVTANLNIDYRRPAMANSYVVLRAETVKVDGRKAWVEGRLETLPEEGQEPTVLAEAKALFVEPKQAKTMSSLYKVT